MASGQDGVVARWQLLEVGVSCDQIKRWIRTGLLHRRYGGVYSVGHTALSPLGRYRAAVLACGDGALLSHGTAAQLWGLLETSPAAVEITVVGRQPRSKPGLQVHRAHEIPPQDIRVKGGLALTSPARTLIDLSAYVGAEELDRLVAEARVRGLLRAGELEAAVARAGHRRGVGAIRTLLAGEAEPAITRSEGERIIRRFLTQARLPQPKFNAHVDGWSVDLLWQEEKLVVEFDGFQFHGHRRAFERDRRKDVALANLGYQVLRFTWRQLQHEPFVVIASIARALERRRP